MRNANIKCSRIYTRASFARKWYQCFRAGSSILVVRQSETLQVKPKPVSYQYLFLSLSLFLFLSLCSSSFCKAEAVPSDIGDICLTHCFAHTDMREIWLTCDLSWKSVCAGKAEAACLAMDHMCLTYCFAHPHWGGRSMSEMWFALGPVLGKLWQYINRITPW